MARRLWRWQSGWLVLPRRPGDRNSCDQAGQYCNCIRGETPVVVGRRETRNPPPENNPPRFDLTYLNLRSGKQWPFRIVLGQNGTCCSSRELPLSPHFCQHPQGSGRAVTTAQGLVGKLRAHLPEERNRPAEPESSWTLGRVPKEFSPASINPDAHSRGVPTRQEFRSRCGSGTASHEADWNKSEVHAASMGGVFHRLHPVAH